MKKNEEDKDIRVYVQTTLTAALMAMACCSAFVACAEKAAGATPAVYVNQDGTHIEVYAGNKSYSIAGKKTAMFSPIGLAAQAPGDIVYSDREGDRRPGTIVTLPPGEGNVTAKYIIKCKDLTPRGVSIDAYSTFG